MQLSQQSPCRGRATGWPSAGRVRVCATPLRAHTSINRHLSPGVVTHAAAAATSTPTQAAVDESAILDTVVVGGGLSGLCTGQALASKHADTVSSFLITEGRERVGGNITTVSDEKYLWEEGPNSFTPNDAMLEIAVDSGITDQLVMGDPTAPRFVYWDNKLRATPSSNPISAITFDLLSWPGKIRAGLGAVGLYKDAPPPAYEETVKQFINRNLGSEVFERLIEPFCSGVYAGDPSKLSMKAAFGKIYDLEGLGGSLVGGALKLMQKNKDNPPPPRDPKLPPKPPGATVASFRRGLKTLPEAIAAILDANIRVSWELKAMEKKDDVYHLQYSTPDGDKTLRTRSVALTVPSYVASSLLADAAPASGDALGSFDYPPVAAVTVVYPESDIREDRKDAAGTVPGFGQLHPRSQGITTLGTIYSSTLFPDRAPPGTMLVLCYIGGAQNRGIVEQSEDEVYAQVDKDLRVMLVKPDAAEPVKVGMRVWKQAIPQFNLGHLETLDKAKAGLQDAGLDGVFLGGNYVSGVALGKVVEYGYTFAAEVATHLKAPATK